jgi:hypothetical protein
LNASAESFSELALPDVSLSKYSLPLRREAIAEAKSWPSGPSPDRQVPAEVYRSGSYTVALCKPGKESPITYQGCRHKEGMKTNNPNDMTPRVFVGQEQHQSLPTFTDVFEDLQHIGRSDAVALELVGSLFFRGAFMLDFVRTSEGRLRWVPAAKVQDRILETIPNVGDLPTDVWMHQVMALALNEDVKYDTLGYDIKQGLGRENPPFACAHIVAVFLDRASLAKFAGSFARPPVGVSALPKTKGPEFFPALAPRG